MLQPFANIIEINDAVFQQQHHILGHGRWMQICHITNDLVGQEIEVSAPYSG